MALKDYVACLNYLKQAEKFFKENEALLDTGSSSSLSNNSNPSMMNKVRDSVEAKRVTFHKLFVVVFH